MSVSTITDAGRSDCEVAVASATPTNSIEQAQRIMLALGVTHGGVPRVGEETLASYHKYLAANLVMPFVAFYPQPKNSRESAEFRRVVVELLDPSRYACDEIDGIFCKTCQADFEVNLPLIELHLPANSPNSQLIEDYWYWMWNWR
jgi:hypothetical protein